MQSICWFQVCYCYWTNDVLFFSEYTTAKSPLQSAHKSYLNVRRQSNFQQIQQTQYMSVNNCNSVRNSVARVTARRSTPWPSRGRAINTNGRAVPRTETRENISTNWRSDSSDLVETALSKSALTSSPPPLSHCFRCQQAPSSLLVSASPFANSSPLVSTR